jgi:hypothetical protein
VSALRRHVERGNKVDDSMRKLYFIFKVGVLNGFFKWKDAAGLRKQKDDIGNAVGKLIQLPGVLIPVQKRLQRVPLRDAFNSLKAKDPKPDKMKRAF